MKDYQVTKGNLNEYFNAVQEELKTHPLLIATTQSGNTGKWGMAQLWRVWMAATADMMASRGITMPLMIDACGFVFKTRPFNSYDAHELFTTQWLMSDDKGERLSWSKKGRDGMRAATKEERYYALNRHEIWALDKGLTLFRPRDSEYDQLQRDETQC